MYLFLKDKIELVKHLLYWICSTWIWNMISSRICRVPSVTTLYIFPRITLYYVSTSNSVIIHIYLYLPTLGNLLCSHQANKEIRMTAFLFCKLWWRHTLLLTSDIALKNAVSPPLAFMLSGCKPMGGISFSFALKWIKHTVSFDCWITSVIKFLAHFFSPEIFINNERPSKA